MSDQEVHKARKSRGDRLSRLLKSTVNPKAWAHLIKIVNYYNYTHVAEFAQDHIAPIGKAGRGADVKIRPDRGLGELGHMGVIIVINDLDQMCPGFGIDG